MKRVIARSTAILSGDSVAATLVRATISSGALRLVGVAVTFVIGVQLARFLGPSELGIYGVVFSLLAILNFLAQLGLPLLATREMAANEARAQWGAMRGVIGWFTIGVLAASFAVALVSFAVLSAWPRPIAANFRDAALFGIVALPLFSLTATAAAMLRGLHHVVQSQALDVLIRPAAFCILIGAGYLIWGKLTAADALALHVIAALVTLLVAYLWLWRATPAIVRQARSVRSMRRWIAAALPLGLSDALRTFDGAYGMLLMGAFATSAETGVYRVALSSVAFVALPTSLVNVTMLPTIARYFALEDRIGLQRALSVAAAAMLAATTALTLFLFLFGAPLISMVFGSEYAGSWLPLMVLCIPQLLNSVFGLSVSLLAMAHEERWLASSYIVAVAIAGPAAWAMIPSLGGVGAAIAASLSLLILNISTWWRAWRRLGVDSSILGVVTHLRVNVS